jgi:hypothetical protein
MKEAPPSGRTGPTRVNVTASCDRLAAKWLAAACAGVAPPEQVVLLKPMSRTSAPLAEPRSAAVIAESGARTGAFDVAEPAIACGVVTSTVSATSPLGSRLKPIAGTASSGARMSP